MMPNLPATQQQFPLFEKHKTLPTTVKALSLRQPWATLMMLCMPSVSEAMQHLGEGGLCVAPKQIETRSWKTPHRGPLLIHASKNREDAEALFFEEPFFEVLGEWGGFGSPSDLPYGALLGLGRLDAIWRTETVEFKDGELDRYEEAFGNYSPGRFAWHMPCAVPFDEPIAYAGALYLFDVPTTLLPEEAHVALKRWLKR